MNKNELFYITTCAKLMMLTIFSLQIINDAFSEYNWRKDRAFFAKEICQDMKKLVNAFSICTKEFQCKEK